MFFSRKRKDIKFLKCFTLKIAKDHQNYFRKNGKVWTIWQKEGWISEITKRKFDYRFEIVNP